MAQVPLAGTDWIPGWPTLTHRARPPIGRGRDHRRRRRRAEHGPRPGGAGSDATCWSSSEPPSARAAAASPAESSAATTASGPWPPWPGTRCRFSKTPPRSWVRHRATTRPATWSAWARESRGAAGQRGHAPRARDRGGAGRPRRGRRGMWPAADWTTSPSSPTSRGAATATAIRRPWPSAVAARRGGARLRQNSAASPPSSGRATGSPVSACADGDRIGAGHVVLAAGPWSVALAAPLGIDLPIRAQRAQILLVDPGQPIEPPTGVLRPGLAPVRAHRGGGVILLPATATTPGPSGPIPTTTASVPATRN